MRIERCVIEAASLIIFVTIVGFVFAFYSLGH